MKYLQYGIHDDNALEGLQEIEDIEKVILSPLKRLNSLLGMVTESKPESIPGFVANLESKFESLVSKDYVELKQIDIEERIDGLPNLKGYPKVAKLSVNYVLEGLALPDDVDWFSEKLEVTKRVYLRSLLSARYHYILTLTETIDRTEAIEIYKKHFEKVNREWVAENKERFQNLEEFFEDKSKRDPENPGWVGLVSEVEEGKVLIRTDSCLWADAMVDYPDSELKFLVCCYGDYTSIKISNKHFELTMEHSIAGGHGYCDCVVHDTRINDSLDHPSDEFFANLSPSKEPE